MSQPLRSMVCSSDSHSNSCTLTFENCGEDFAQTGDRRAHPAAHTVLWVAFPGYCHQDCLPLGYRSIARFLLSILDPAALLRCHLSRVLIFSLLPDHALSLSLEISSYSSSCSHGALASSSLIISLSFSPLMAERLCQCYPQLSLVSSLSDSRQKGECNSGSPASLMRTLTAGPG